MGSSPVAVTWTSNFVPALSKEFLDIQTSIECGFTLKRLRDMTRTYNQKPHLQLFLWNNYYLCPLDFLVLHPSVNKKIVYDVTSINYIYIQFFFSSKYPLISVTLIVSASILFVIKDMEKKEYWQVFKWCPENCHRGKLQLS